MIVNIQDEDEASFLRHWTERVYDRVQLAQIEAIEANLVQYAMTAWRPMNIEPPFDVLIMCACDDGLQLMAQSKLGEWRTNAGLPHKPPLAWMPCPVLPNGGFRRR
jgi:hypothetical protein